MDTRREFLKKAMLLSGAAGMAGLAPQSVLAGATPFSSSITEIKGNKKVILKEDKSSLIRNPAMGWTLYDDAYDHPSNAHVYWNEQDTAARKYAGGFYLRYRWADLEPREGEYAWMYNDNYKELVQGAVDRGLRLGFRVFFDSRDMSYPSTPQYVKDAGAQGYLDERGNSGKHLWSPYPTDPIFREKFEKFIQALAREYNNPEYVDYLDYGLGLWGEGWNCVTPTNPSGFPVAHDPGYWDSFKWLLATYAKYFDKVLPDFNFNDNWEHQKKIGVYEYHDELRRDGLGGNSFPNERGFVDQVFPGVCVFGESHYWMNGRKWDPNFQPWREDTVYGDNGNQQFQSWRDVYEQTIKDAWSCHANTLDLREAGETKGWLTEAPDLVNKFMLEGGYRFYPSMLSVPETVKAGDKFKIVHQWVNRGIGVCPNNNIRWNFKYKPAFALFTKRATLGHQRVKIWIDEDAEPSEWLKGKENKYVLEETMKGVPKGKYLLCLAIIDKTRANKTRANKPGINLAVTTDQIDDWYVIHELNVE
jgi:hypothetical protein